MKNEDKATRLYIRSKKQSENKAEHGFCFYFMFLWILPVSTCSILFDITAVATVVLVIVLLLVVVVGVECKSRENANCGKEENRMGYSGTYVAPTLINALHGAPGTSATVSRIYLTTSLWLIPVHSAGVCFSCWVARQLSENNCHIYIHIVIKWESTTILTVVKWMKREKIIEMKRNNVCTSVLLTLYRHETKWHCLTFLCITS